MPSHSLLKVAPTANLTHERHPEQFGLGSSVLLLFDGPTESVEEVERFRTDTFLDELRVAVGGPRSSGNAKGTLRLRQKPLRIGSVTEFGFGDAVDKRMRLQ